MSVVFKYTKVCSPVYKEVSVVFKHTKVCSPVYKEVSVVFKYTKVCSPVYIRKSSRLVVTGNDDDSPFYQFTSVSAFAVRAGLP